MSLRTLKVATISLVSTVLAGGCSAGTNNTQDLGGGDASGGTDAGTDTSQGFDGGDAGSSVDAANGDSADDGGTLIDGGSRNDAGDGGGTPSGTYAFLGGDVLSILNATDPTSIQLVGKFAPKEYVTGVAIGQGTLVYATSSNFGGKHTLHVLDATDVSNVTEVGSLATESGFPLDGPIALSGNYAYVGETGELEVVDVSSPSAPAHAGKLTVTGGVRSLAVAGQYVYLAVEASGQGGGGAMVIADVSSPTAPSLAATVSIASGFPWGVASDGANAYLGLGIANVVNIYDVSQASSPTQVGTIASDGRQIMLAGGYAYLTTMGRSFNVVNVSDPANPGAMVSTKTTFPNSGVTLGPGATRAYVAGFNASNPMEGEGSLEVLDITSPTSPTSLGSYLTLPGGALTAIAVKVYP